MCAEEKRTLSVHARNNKQRLLSPVPDESEKTPHPHGRWSHAAALTRQHALLISSRRQKNKRIRLSATLLSSGRIGQYRVVCNPGIIFKLKRFRTVQFDLPSFLVIIAFQFTVAVCHTV